MPPRIWIAAHCLAESKPSLPAGRTDEEDTNCSYLDRGTLSCRIQVRPVRSLAGPEGIEEKLTSQSTGPGGNILLVLVGAPMISKFMAILQGKGKNSNLHMYIRVYPSIHLHISLDIHTSMLHSLTQIFWGWCSAPRLPLHPRPKSTHSCRN
jgi:hypothetical protein